MSMKVAQYISNFLVKKGVTDVFTITGGGAMHLNDAIGHNRGLRSIYNHHEQACAIAAEGYARKTGKVAAVCVTSGPGGTNAITGVVGGWQDSIPMFVISGQVKRETTTWATPIPLRQLGDQEFQIIDTVSNMTKYAVMITKPEEIRYHLEKAWFLCNNGRKGPVWLDVPLDVQGAMIEESELIGYDQKEDSIENPIYDETKTLEIISLIKEAKRPVILAGTGIRLGDALPEFLEVIEQLKIPVVTAWNAHDVLDYNNPYFCGKPGTVGTRGGNFVVQGADLLLVLGCRMNIRMISYNYKDFASGAKKIVVDIDEYELKKPTVQIEYPIHANVKDVLCSLKNELSKESINLEKKDRWLKWCKEIDQKFPAVLEEYKTKDANINPYVFIEELFEKLTTNDDVICGNGSACVITFQAAKIKQGQRVFTNSGCAAMGYGFPAAIGVNISQNNEKRTICIDGDGSFQMNLQELQTVVQYNLNLKIFIINNNGYHSIRQTQTNLFQPPLIGVSSENGISFPDLEKIAMAYGISYHKITSNADCKKEIEQALNSNYAELIEVVVDANQNFEPKLSSKVLEDGRIVSPSIDDMFPFLGKEYEIIKKSLEEV